MGNESYHSHTDIDHKWNENDYCINCSIRKKWNLSHPTLCRYPKERPKGLCNFYRSDFGAHWCATSFVDPSTGDQKCCSCGFSIQSHLDDPR